MRLGYVDASAPDGPRQRVLGGRRITMIDDLHGQAPVGEL
jgi:hypothetical protein